MKKFTKKAIALVAVAALTLTTFVGCSVKDSEVVATVDGAEITAGLANFYVRYQQSSIESMYSSYYGDTFWTMEVEDGMTFEESVKKSVMETLQELYILKLHTDDYKVALTDEDKAAIDKAAEAFVSANSDKVKEQISGNKEVVAEYLELVAIATKMDKAIKADVDTEVSDEEAAQKKLRYVQFATVTTAEDGSTSELSAEQKAEKKIQAEAFLKSAKENGSLETFAKQAGNESKTLTFDSKSTDISEDAIKAADKLAEKEFTELIEAQDGYYVIQLESTFDREATDAEKDNIIETRKTELYTKVVDEWKEEADVEVFKSVWRKIDISVLKITAKEEKKEESTSDTTTDKTEDATTEDDASTEKDTTEEKAE